jgi:hypothetical protein
VLNPLSADFCRRCNAPVGDYTSWKPFERIFAEGFVYRRVVEGGVRSWGPAKLGRMLLGLSMLGTGAAVAWSFTYDVVQTLRRRPFGQGSDWGAKGFALLMGLVIGYVGLRLLGCWPRRRSRAAESAPDAESPEGGSDPDGQRPEGNDEAAPGSRLLLVFTVLVVIALGALLIAGLFLGR